MCFPLWIFSLREKFRYDEPFVRGYSDIWSKLRKLYRRCARWTLGVHPNSSGEAVLVRLGWLPLDYLLALHGLKLFLKLSLGLGSKVLQSSTVDRGVLPGHGHGTSFSRAHEFLTYLNQLTEVDLFSQNILKNDAPLRDALFLDLNRCWQCYKGAERTRSLHPSWKACSISMGMRIKQGTSLLHGAACGTGVLRCDLKKYARTSNNRCRKGCQMEETLDHIIHVCPHYASCREKIEKECERLNLEFNV